MSTKRILGKLVWAELVLLGLLGSFVFSGITQAQEIKTLSSFESENELVMWRADKDVTMRLSPDHATEGKYSCKVTFPIKGYGFRLEHPKISDWSGYGLFQFDVYNPSQETITLHMRIDDTEKKVFTSSTYVIQKASKESITIFVGDIEKRVNIRSIAVIMPVIVNPSQETTLYLDNFHLIGKEFAVKKNVNIPMEDVTYWIYTPSGVGNTEDSKVTLSKDCIEGSHSMRIDYRFANTDPDNRKAADWLHFTKSVEWDLASYGILSFWLKGDGSGHILIVTLIDSLNRANSYGPFYLKSSEWVEYKALIKQPPWKDKDFDFTKVSKIRLWLNEEGEGVNKEEIHTGAVYIDDLKLIEEESMEELKSPMIKDDNVEYWRYTPTGGHTEKSRIGISEGRTKGSNCLKIDYHFANTDPGYNKAADKFFFTKTVDWDFTAYDMMTFWLKGSGERHALIIQVSDSDNRQVAYGPFWLDDTNWAERKFFLGAPAWKCKDFNFKEVRKIAVGINEDEKDRERLHTGTTYIDDLRLLNAGEEKEKSDSDSNLQWKVSNLNSNNNLIVDGKPFFPLGIYSTIGVDKASVPWVKYSGEFTEDTVKSWFKDMSDAGFNMVFSYAMPSFGAPEVLGVGGASWKQSRFLDENGRPRYEESLRKAIIKFMDYANEFGIKTMVRATMYSNIYGMKEKRDIVWEGRKEHIAGNIKAWKNHPGLAAWYLADEPTGSGALLRDVQDHYSYIRSLDDVHPMVIVASMALDITEFSKVTDILAPDPYPIGSKSHDIISYAKILNFVHQVQTGSPKRPVGWNVVQLHNAAPWASPENKKRCRFPTQDEIRAMAFLSLTQDAKGLFFFTFNYDNEFPLPQKYPMYWEGVSKVVRSIHSVFPALFSPEIVTGYTVSDERLYTIMRRVKEKGHNYLYLFAVNPNTEISKDKDKDDEDFPIALGKVTFSNIPATEDSVVTVLDEDSQGKLKLGSRRKIELIKTGPSTYSFTDTFGKLSTHVYKIGSGLTKP